MIYAVNKWTKEHRLYEMGDECDPETWAIVSADPDGWIEWPGGECPLPDGVPYEERDRLGRVTKLYHPEMNEEHWEHRSGDDDTMAYRPIIDANPEAPAWNGENLAPGSHWRVDGEYGGIVEFVTTIEGEALVRDVESGYFYGSTVPFAELAPIRSEEGRAVEEMAVIISDGFNVIVDDCIDTARALYRAGYRKAAAADGEDE